jgi:hypothetical protein
VYLVHFVVWAAIGGSLFVHTCRCCVDQFFSTQPFEDYFKVVVAQTTMTRTLASDWTPWYVDLGDGRAQCLICGDAFTKKNTRILSHLGYIPSSGARDNNVKLCKNMKLDVLHVFHGCGGLAPSSARSLQQSTIPVLHAQEQRHKCDMAWAEFFYSANIPFAVARSASFKKAMKMTSEMRKSYLPPSYHDIQKRLFNETKHKIKAQIAERTKMFIRTYGTTLA